MLTLTPRPTFAQTLGFLVGLLALPALGHAQRPGGARPPGDLAALLDPVLVNGPATPEEMIGIVTLDASQYERYATDYRAFMTETQPVRDSVATLRATLRDRFTRGAAPEEHSGVRPVPGGLGESALGDLLKRMEKRQKTFDQILETFLTADQVKKYQAWREDGRRRAMDDLGIPRGGRRPS